jgi:hypothetical protein
MKSSINEGSTKEVRPEIPPLVPRQDLDFTNTEAPVSEAKAKLVVRFPRQGELPLPITLANVAHATRLNAFRHFGINE